MVEKSIKESSFKRRHKSGIYICHRCKMEQVALLISDKSKSLWKDPEYIEKTLTAMDEYIGSDRCKESREKTREKLLNRNTDYGYRVSEKIDRKAQSKRSIKMWKNKEIRNKIVASLCKNADDEKTLRDEFRDLFR